MKKHNPYLTLQQAIRRYKKLSVLFCVHLQEHLRVLHAIRWQESVPLIYWIDAHRRLTYARLETHVMPDRQHLNRPTVFQIAWRRYPVAQGGIGLRFTDIDLDIWSFELHLLPDQVLDFVPWFVRFIEAHRFELKRMLPEPPYPCQFSGRYDFHCREAWTESVRQMLDKMRMDEQPL